MPRKQSTAAQRARQRQATTGENYTTALRAQPPGTVRHLNFSATGAGWAPILERAERQLDQLWPGHPGPRWEEKFGELWWKGIPAEASPAARRAIWDAIEEANATCQTCPAPGRARVVWIWDDEYGWVMPWVKNCCDSCAFVPTHLRDDQEYLDLVEQYEEPN